ncbi:MAG: hypothetical protein ACRDRP_15335 [Pseudonocardiaceae bacterium]
MSLDVGDQVRLLLLQRVRAGAISEFWGTYFDGGGRIWHLAQAALANLVEFGRVELIYPPDSGVWRQNDYGPGELVYGVHAGLSVADRTRTAALTELGLGEYEELRERQRATVAVLDR